VTLSHYELERLLARVASGTTTERDARVLRQVLRASVATDAVASDKPQR
jgi:hypothetical protein